MQAVLSSPWALFFSGYAFLTVARILRDHAVALLPWALCLFSVEYLRIEPDAPGTPWCAMVYGVIATAWVLSGRGGALSSLSWDRPLRCLGLFVLWSLASLALNRNWGPGATAMVKLLYGLSAFFICRVEGLGVRSFLLPLSLAGAIIGGDLLLHELRGVAGDAAFGWRGHGRSCVNILANVEVLVVAAWLPFLPSLRGLRRAAVLSLLVFSSLVILAAASRQAALSLFVVLALWSLRRPDLRRRIAIAFAAGLVVLAAGSSTFALARRFETLLDSAQGRETTDVSVKFRRLAMQIGVEMFRDNPVLGVGPGGYPDRSVDYATSELLGWRRLTTAPELRYTSPHSLYLRVADEVGLPGLLLLVGVLGGIAWGAARRFRGMSPSSEEMGVLLILVPLYVSTLVSDSLRWSPVMWGFLGVAHGVFRGREGTRSSTTASTMTSTATSQAGNGTSVTG